MYESEESFIGEALNEGYTELLVGRYFKEKQELVKNELKEEIYYYEKIYANALEMILSKEKMEKFYFNSDLFSLIRKLRKFYDSQEIIDFLIKTDFILRYRNRAFVGLEELEIINLELEDIICFLVKGYCLKLLNEKNSLDKNIELITNFFNYINEPIEFRFDRVTSINLDRVMEIIENIMGYNINLNGFKSKQNML